MNHCGKLPLLLALTAMLFWILPPAAWAEEMIGAPYRGPYELAGTGEGGVESGNPDTEGIDTGPQEDPNADPTGDDPQGATPTATEGRGKKAKLDGKILWQWWWELNKDRFLARSTERGRIAAGSAYYWFGAGAKFPPREINPISDTMRAGPIYKAIKANLGYNDAGVRAAACIALGRIGNVPATDKAEGKPANMVVRDLTAVLKSQNATIVHIAAVLGLGISGDTEGCEWLRRHEEDLRLEVRPYVHIAYGLSRYLPAIKHLVDELPRSGQDKDTPESKIAALHAIGLYGPEAVEALNADGLDGVAKIVKIAKSAIRAGNGPIAAQSVATLSRIQQGLDTVGKAAGSKTQGIKWTALLSLANYSDNEKAAQKAFKVLKGKSGFDAGEGQSKVFSTLALGDLAGRLDPNSKTRTNIIRFLHSNALESKKNNYVRGASAIALGAARDGTAVDGIVNLLQDKTVDDWVVGAACVGLGLLRANDKADVIIDSVLEKKSWKADARGYGLIGLALMGDTSRMGQIIKVASSTTEKEIKRQMSLAMGLLGDQGDVFRLAQYFTTPWKSHDRYLVSNAAFGLSWIQDQKAVDRLVKAATSSVDAKVRGMSTIALGYTGATDRISPLTRCFENISHRFVFTDWGILFQISRIL